MTSGGSMDLKCAEELLETLAWMSVPIDKLDIELNKIADIDERKIFKEHFKELVRAFYNIQGDISDQYRELDPMFGGIEKHSLLRKKYETESFKVELPSAERISQALNTAEKIRNYSSSK